VLIAVYQGESSNTLQNTFIGEFSAALENQHDRKIDIHFAYDLSGTINISVTEAGSKHPRVYSMDLSRSADENSDLGEFSGQLLEQGEPSSDSGPEVTNYLVEIVGKRLRQEGEAAPEAMYKLLETYKLLLEQDADDELDEIEDELYDWVESD
jgi:molecular chaperone DnaK (HSP70)